MTTDHTGEALAAVLNQHSPETDSRGEIKRCSCGLLFGIQHQQNGSYEGHRLDLLAAHVAGAVESETTSLRESAESALASGRTAVEDGRRLLALVEGKDAEIERLLRGARCPQCSATEWNGAAIARHERDEARAAVDVAVAAERERIAAAIERLIDLRKDYLPGLTGAQMPHVDLIEHEINTVRNILRYLRGEDARGWAHSSRWDQLEGLDVLARSTTDGGDTDD